MARGGRNAHRSPGYRMAHMRGVRNASYNRMLANDPEYRYEQQTLRIIENARRYIEERLALAYPKASVRERIRRAIAEREGLELEARLDFLYRVQHAVVMRVEPARWRIRRASSLALAACRRLGEPEEYDRLAETGDAEHLGGGVECAAYWERQALRLLAEVRRRTGYEASALRSDFDRPTPPERLQAARAANDELRTQVDALETTCRRLCTDLQLDWNKREWVFAQCRRLYDTAKGLAFLAGQDDLEAEATALTLHIDFYVWLAELISKKK